MTRPFALFARESIIQLFSLYTAFLYGVLYRKSSISYLDHC